MENRKEFDALILKYQSITLEDIIEASANFKPPYEDYTKDMEDIANMLTGFGSPGTCTLCLPVDAYCTKCAWGPEKWGCMKHESYNAIDLVAKTPEELLTAFKERADYMEEYLETIK